MTQTPAWKVKVTSSTLGRNVRRCDTYVEAAKFAHREIARLRSVGGTVTIYRYSVSDDIYGIYKSTNVIKGDVVVQTSEVIATAPAKGGRTLRIVRLVTGFAVQTSTVNGSWYTDQYASTEAEARAAANILWMR